MPYRNTQTNTFGHSVSTVRSAYPRVSIPEGANHGVFTWYVPSNPPPHDSRVQVAVEIMPANNMQQWRVDPAPVEQVIASVTAAVQQRLDAFARSRNYDSILSACTYATSTVPKFAAEGQYAVNARDASWATCYQIMAAVQAGQRPMPSVEQVLSELPVLDWPK
ncbi:hypothetical protein LJR074_001975 [Acidovorax sp. LjRoot74]|uniref:hypothetical protein n=1 Tax=Acidovorax sp. LjRoot74 TaxID=3342337 RepID=UPI003ED15C36